MIWEQAVYLLKVNVFLLNNFSVMSKVEKEYGVSMGREWFLHKAACLISISEQSQGMKTSWKEKDCKQSFQEECSIRNLNRLLLFLMSHHQENKK